MQTIHCFDLCSNLRCGWFKSLFYTSNWFTIIKIYNYEHFWKKTCYSIVPELKNNIEPFYITDLHLCKTYLVANLSTLRTYISARHILLQTFLHYGLTSLQDISCCKPFYTTDLHLCKTYLVANLSTLRTYISARHILLQISEKRQWMINGSPNIFERCALFFIKK